MVSRAALLFAALFLAAVIVVATGSNSLVGGFGYRDKMAEAAAETLAALATVALVVERAMSVVNAIIYGDAQRSAEQAFATAQGAAAQDLSRVFSQKERLRLLGSFFAGLFVSAAGVRTLEGLLVVDRPNPLLFPVDVILTGALIAGGSNLIAYLAQITKDRFAGSQPQPAPVQTAAGKGMANTGAVPDSRLRARLITSG